MRTTLEIDDDILQVAREIAHVQDIGIGRVVSELARRGLKPRDPGYEIVDGIPMLKHGPEAVTVTNDMVRKLMDEE